LQIILKSVKSNSGTPACQRITVMTAAANISQQLSGTEKSSKARVSLMSQTAYNNNNGFVYRATTLQTRWNSLMVCGLCYSYHACASVTVSGGVEM